ncbi:MAG: ferredoxin-type protein NapG [Desulfobulbaceae bacterium]|nr:MAG: ferredoxin-type protein NapG [Desulfobulbaceae bacterium]
MSDAEVKDQAHASRRRFLLGSAKTACGVALFGLGLGFYGARQSEAMPYYAMRPPGALDEKRFLAACIRCGQCVRACPYSTLRLAAPEEKVATGTPYFIARQIPCELCENRPCITACPSGALDPTLTDIYQARMGLAVVMDQESCLNFLGLRCDVCYRSCPLLDKAISLDAQHNRRSGKHTLFIPTVHSKHCTGCGKCEKSCVLEKAAIKVVPLVLAKGELGKHYRLGWEEKSKAGRSLIPEQLDLPDRLPEFDSPLQPEWKP